MPSAAIMMTSSNGNIFRVTGPLCGEFTGPSEFPTQRPVTRSFDVFFDLRLNKRLSKQPWGWWFETPSWSLWHQSNDGIDKLCFLRNIYNRYRIKSLPLKQKCRHFDEIFITGCTGSCHFDNFQCSQWWTFHQNEDFSVSVTLVFVGCMIAWHRTMTTL